MHKDALRDSTHRSTTSWTQHARGNPRCTTTAAAYLARLSWTHYQVLLVGTQNDLGVSKPRQKHTHVSAPHTHSSEVRCWARVRTSTSERNNICSSWSCRVFDCVIPNAGSASRNWKEKQLCFRSITDPGVRAPKYCRTAYTWQQGRRVKNRCTPLAKPSHCGQKTHTHL